MRPKPIYKTNWNLTLLFAKGSSTEIQKARKEAEKATCKFIKKWKKRSDYLKKPRILKEALDEYELWLAKWGANAKERYFFSLKNSLNQEDPAIKAKLLKSVEFGKNLQNDIRFFKLGIAKIDKRQQSKFLKYKTLKPYRHFLERLFERSKHFLSDPEEKIMNLKTTPSYSNWVRMFSSFLAKEEREVLDENGKRTIKNFSEILGLINSKNKKVRGAAAKALNEIFEKNLAIAENEINSVLLNKKIDDELRGYKRPDAERHLDDDIGSEVVDMVVKTATNNFKIAGDYYKLKARLFKVPRLPYHERNVEYGNIDKKYSFNEGISLVNKVLCNLDSELSDIFLKLLKNGQIDFHPKKGKRSGAFAHYNLISHPTYILLNWTNRLNDVRTLAHELGHAINYELTREKQNAINFGVAISTTEVASTFFEDFVTDELMHQADDELKLMLMVNKLDSDVSSIFRQIALYNFEWELHGKLQETGYLSKEEIGKLFAKHMHSYMGDGVSCDPGSQNWWVYVQHFRYFFYVYSYASGLLISKSLQAEARKNPKFVKKVRGFLSAGISAPPKTIFANLGIDIAEKKFWEKGIREVSDFLSETESLAKKLKKI